MIDPRTRFRIGFLRKLASMGVRPRDMGAAIRLTQGHTKQAIDFRNLFWLLAVPGLGLIGGKYLGDYLGRAGANLTIPDPTEVAAKVTPDDLAKRYRNATSQILAHRRRKRKVEDREQAHLVR